MIEVDDADLSNVARSSVPFRYVGSELDIFASAVRWKSYWSNCIRPHLRGDTLEVGAGIGTNTKFLRTLVTGRWVCLEPDADLFLQLEKNLNESSLTRDCERSSGTLQSIARDDAFDTILYIDVLEHIEDDAGELQSAAARLRPGGRVIVLSPAHQFLYTPFDAAIGHFRRYNRESLRKISPPGLRLEKLFYLDACGVLLSAANRLLLRQSMPNKAQIRVWDKWVIPVSRSMDPLLMHAFGKSIIGIWHRP